MEKAKRNRDENKLRWVTKLGNCCTDCKQTFPLEVYDFHHLDPKEKEFSPGSIMYKKEELLEPELSKCILLCANCHRIRHFGTKI